MSSKIPRDWPDERDQGLIPTTNAMGIMTREPSAVSLRFAEQAGRTNLPVLEIGAAFGNATYPALEAGGTVVACDIAADELARLRRPVPPELQKRLITIPARFPDELHFTSGSLGAILASQVIHFFEGEAVERAMAAAYDWLEAGEGRIYLVVITPRLSFYTQCEPEFQRRKAEGQKWPGIFNPKEFAPADWVQQLPDLIHLFDADVLRRAVEEAGFVVEHLEPFCFENFPDKYRNGGGEFLGLVARKP